MPADVQTLYSEAAAVAAVSRRAGAALARATIERLLKELDTQASTKAKLDERIARIRERVSPDLGQILDVVRFAGNKVLHGDEQPSELIILALDDQTGPQVLETLLAAANDLVDELISRPMQRRQLWEKLPAQVKDEIERKQQAQKTTGGTK